MKLVNSDLQDQKSRSETVPDSLTDRPTRIRAMKCYCILYLDDTFFNFLVYIFWVKRLKKSLRILCSPIVIWLVKLGKGKAHIGSKYIRVGSAQMDESGWRLMQPILTPDGRSPVCVCGRRSLSNVWQTGDRQPPPHPLPVLVGCQHGQLSLPSDRKDAQSTEPSKLEGSGASCCSSSLFGKHLLSLNPFVHA